MLLVCTSCSFQDDLFSGLLACVVVHPLKRHPTPAGPRSRPEEETVPEQLLARRSHVEAPVVPGGARATHPRVPAETAASTAGSPPAAAPLRDLQRCRPVVASGTSTFVPWSRATCTAGPRPRRRVGVRRARASGGGQAGAQVRARSPLWVTGDAVASGGFSQRRQGS